MLLTIVTPEDGGEATFENGGFAVLVSSARIEILVDLADAFAASGEEIEQRPPGGRGPANLVGATNAADLIQFVANEIGYQVAFGFDPPEIPEDAVA